LAFVHIILWTYSVIVGTHSTLFRYTPCITWEIWLAKPSFHEYAWGMGDLSCSNEFACYNKKVFNLNNVIQGFYYWKRKCCEVRLGQCPWPVARLAQFVEQRIGVPRVVCSSPTPGTNCSPMSLYLCQKWF